MTESHKTGEHTGTTRRTVLRGAVVAGVVMPLLSACGSDSSSSDRPTSTGGRPSGDDPASSAGGGAGGVIATTNEVPEGGGVILGDSKVVITQPAAGEFKAFSSICTHQGCPLDNVTDGTINCTCHGSMFSIEDGSVVGGPAPSPLPETPITVKGSDISLSS